MNEIIILALAKKYADSVGEKVSREGFHVQVEQDRSILNSTGQEKIFYFLPKTSDNPTDGYDEYIYTNNAWEQVGSTDIDLSAYYTKTEIDNKGYLTQHQDISGKADKATTLSGYGITDAQSKIDNNNKLSSDLVDDTNNTNKFVTTNEKSAWNGKYDKPSGGIPSTDLASAVQTSLGKADTALQSHQDISGKENTSNKVTSISAQSTDDQYPTAKCVYDAIDSAIASQATDLSSATVTLSASSFTYDGTSKVPSVISVVLDGQTLISGTDYAVVSSPATNAGSYTLTVNGIGDYKGTITVNWAINKAQATISGADSIGVVGIGESQSETYTTTGDGAMSFSISDSSVATISNSGGQVTVTGVTAGSTMLTVTVADGTNYTGTTKTVSVAVTEASANTVFGVVWDYSLSSPALTRLTPQTDPLEVVTDCPTTEPTACVGTTGGQSDFDSYLPWSGMVRKNYVNGQITDFTSYDNGETYVFIPEFWSKIVDDSENSKMYFYISSEELTGFTKHPGSGRYIGRYQCDANFESKPNGYAKTNISLADFRTGISGVNNDRFVYDVHTYMAIVMLYIVEWANLNSQAKIGYGVAASSISAKPMGETDVLNYHTGRTSGVYSESAIQYRWIENIYYNAWDFLDGILINNGKVYVCLDSSKYSDTITNDYIDTGIIIPTNQGWIKNLDCLNNTYLFPKGIGGSNTTYVCDQVVGGQGLRCCLMGCNAHNHETAGGLFMIDFTNTPPLTHATVGARPIFKIGGDA